MRFDRNYRLTVGTGAGAVIIRPPLRCVFTVDKSVSGGLNKADITLYNLAPQTQKSLSKDPTETGTSAATKRIPVILEIGYNGGLQTIFKGSVNKGRSRRQGADFITELNCLDGGDDFLLSFTSRTVLGRDKALSEILRDMPNTGRGKIGRQSELIRPKVLVGNSVQLVEDLLDADQTWYIDNEQLFVIRDNEVVSGFIPAVSAETGLINTPEREDRKVTFQTLMNPSLKLGAQCSLQTTTAAQLNAVYKITSMTYAGDTDGRSWQQTVSGEVVPDATVIR